MATYKVRITEYLSRIVEIELDDEFDEGDALAEVETDYCNGNIVLGYDDFDDVEFNIYEE
jgi:hypothetical protein